MTDLKNYAKIGMRKAGNTQYRPEQFKLQKYLMDTSVPHDIRLEFVIGARGKIIAIADVIDMTTKTIYRLNGGYHKSKRQRMKDEDQKETLEELGYTVEDIEQDSEWAWLWA